MSGSTISIIAITAAFTALAFIVALIVIATAGASKIAAEQRMEDLKKREGEADVVLVKSEKKKNKKRRESQNSFFIKFASNLYRQLQSADIKMRPEEFLLIWILVAAIPGFIVILIVPNMTALAIGLVVVGAVAPFVLLKMKQKKKFGLLFIILIIQILIIKLVKIKLPIHLLMCNQKLQYLEHIGEFLLQ